MQTPVGEIPMFYQLPTHTEGDDEDRLLPIKVEVYELNLLAEIPVKSVQDSINSLNGIQYAHEYLLKPGTPKPGISRRSCVSFFS